MVTVTCVIYTTHYCLKISRDPSKSLFGSLEAPDESSSLEAPKLGFKEIATVSCMFVPFAIYAYGAASLGWGFSNLMAFALLAVLVVGLVNRISPSRLAAMFVGGASTMGGICLMIGFAKVIGTVLTDGNILHTIAYGAVNVIGQLGSAATAAGIFIFTTLFNLLIPSGPAKVPMLIPLFLPVADALGMSRQVLCLAFQLGDGLTNYITPVSSVLAAALAMSGVNYGKWLRYVLPYVCITFVISVAALTFLQSIGWS